MRVRSLASSPTAWILVVSIVGATSLRAQPAGGAASAPPPPTAVAQAPPSTDVFVADLVRAEGGWRIERARNVTHRPGYDNQPCFLPDGERLLYTSQRGDQTDIYELDLATAFERKIRATPESEYSPQLAADGTSVIVVRVESDGTQRLWSFPRTGGEPRVVAPEVKGVGYHAWLDARTVAVFMLGDPFTLQIVELAPDGHASARVVAKGIGRSIHRVPGTRKVSFVAADGAARAIFELDPATDETTRIAPAPPTEEGDYVWIPGGTADGVLLAAVGSTIERLRPGVDTAWTPLTDLAGQGFGKITRLAVSPLGTEIAFVAEP